MDEQLPAWKFGEAPPAWAATEWRYIIELAEALDYAPLTPDIEFVGFLKTFSQFGFFRFGPITIDVGVVEDILMRTHPRGDGGPEHGPATPEYVRLGESFWSLAEERNASHVDELISLICFLRWGEGLPGRVFGELGVSEADLDRYIEELKGSSKGRHRPAAPAQKLYSTESAAEYLGVHVQTVRAWIRSGKLPASRLAGQKSIRIREHDLESVLEPIDPHEYDGN